MKNFRANLLNFSGRQCRRYKNYVIPGLAAMLMLMSNASVSQGRLYRYVNDKGVKVLAYSVPAQYVSNGYEVLDSSGQLIEVVPPELSPEAKAKAAIEKAAMEQLQTWDRQLLKRYSRVSDIEEAKKRKLAEISANINILQGNVINLNNEIDKMQSDAAAIERRGQAVPNAILAKIDAIKEELAVTTDKIQLRQREYQEKTDSFDKDIARFLIIKPDSKYGGEGK